MTWLEEISSVRLNKKSQTYFLDQKLAYFSHTTIFKVFLWQLFFNYCTKLINAILLKTILFHIFNLIFKNQGPLQNISFCGTLYIVYFLVYLLLTFFFQGFEWNKYNQTHYDIDNPPPKIVQGYKFNVSLSSCRRI